MTEAVKSTCVLCGYLAAPGVLFPVPLTSRPMTKVVCDECIAVLTALQAERDAPGAHPPRGATAPTIYPEGMIREDLGHLPPAKAWGLAHNRQPVPFHGNRGPCDWLGDKGSHAPPRHLPGLQPSVSGARVPWPVPGRRLLSLAPALTEPHATDGDCAADFGRKQLLRTRSAFGQCLRNHGVTLMFALYGANSSPA